MDISNVVEWIILPGLGVILGSFGFMARKMVVNRRDSEQRIEQARIAAEEQHDQMGRRAEKRHDQVLENMQSLKSELHQYQVKSEQRFGALVKKSEVDTILDRYDDRIDKRFAAIDERIDESLRAMKELLLALIDRKDK